MLEHPKAEATDKVIEPQMICVGKKHYRGEMDNQQASPFEIGWLLAFLEGEGSTGLYWNQVRQQIYPVTTFVNTEPSLIEEVSRILRHLGVGNFIYNHKMLGKLTHWKDRIDAHVSGIKRNQVMFSRLLPFWTTPTIKRQKAELVLRFCDSRLSKPIAEIGRYSKAEFDIFDQFRALTGKSSEATRSPAADNRKRLNAV